LLVGGPATTVTSPHFYSGCGFMFFRPFLGIPSFALSTFASENAIRRGDGSSRIRT